MSARATCPSAACARSRDTSASSSATRCGSTAGAAGRGLREPAALQRMEPLLDLLLFNQCALQLVAQRRVLPGGLVGALPQFLKLPADQLDLPCPVLDLVLCAKLEVLLHPQQVVELDLDLGALELFRGEREGGLLSRLLDALAEVVVLRLQPLQPRRRRRLPGRHLEVPLELFDLEELGFELALELGAQFRAARSLAVSAAAEPGEAAGSGASTAATSS